VLHCPYLENGKRGVDLTSCFLSQLSPERLSLLWLAHTRSTIVNMRNAKEKLKRVLPSRTPSRNPESSSQPLPTSALRIAGLILDALPIPGAGVAAGPILNVMEKINVRMRSIVLILSLCLPVPCRQSEEQARGQSYRGLQ
jgi:hypothetical protein